LIFDQCISTLFLIPELPIIFAAPQINIAMAIKIAELLGDKADYLLSHKCNTVEKSSLHLPSPTHVDDIWINSNRSNQVLRSLQTLLTTAAWVELAIAASSL
jgi:hypothetical protein